MNIAAVVAAETDHGNVMADTFIYGVVAAVIFGVLALITVSFRNVANRHSAKAEAWAEAHGKDGHGAGHGH